LSLLLGSAIKQSGTCLAKEGKGKTEQEGIQKEKNTCSKGTGMLAEWTGKKVGGCGGKKGGGAPPK